MTSQIRESEVFGYSLGKLIEALRKQRGWTQDQLAQQLGISQAQLSKYENGKAQPGAYEYSTLARLFGMTVEQLNQQVVRIMERTRATAEAATHQKAKTSEQAFSAAVAAAGVMGLVGLIAFVVAALTEDDGETGKKPRH